MGIWGLRWSRMGCDREMEGWFGDLWFGAVVL
jgi:hypothetical protein